VQLICADEGGGDGWQIVDPRWQVEAIDLDGGHEDELVRVLVHNGGHRMFEFQLYYQQIADNLQTIDRLFASQSPSDPKSQFLQKIAQEKEMSRQLLMIRFLMTSPGSDLNEDHLNQIYDILKKWVPIDAYEKIDLRYKYDYHALLK
jgi:hypothetical protein